MTEKPEPPEHICFSIPMTPVAKGRARMTRAGFAYTPAKTRCAEATIKQYAQAAVGDRAYPLYGDSPISVGLEFVFARPKSRKKEHFKATRPDLDNICKSVLDSLNGIVWKDDGQVVLISAGKYWGDSPCINIKIWRVSNE